MKKNKNINAACLCAVVTLMCFALCSPPAWGDEESWIMSIQKEDLSPFKHRNGYGPGGINVDLIAAIADEIGVELRFRDYPIDIGRQKFQKGELSVDCCLNPIWFPGQDNIHVFSDPLYKLIEVWVFPKGKTFPIPSTKALSDKRVVGIKGFTYPNQDDYGVRLNGSSPLEVLQMLVDGKADVAVLERHAASFYINHNKFMVQFGDPYYSVNVAVRLHKNLAHRLDDVNKAVAKLKESGSVKAIIQRNIR
ncbi:transporter substrate-binding domain-containing protein [Terasakiella sp. A23]|uniref:substrate-binding periplasmic protein n=1 Tax=Terasakiella sp. FCG-A23 TaxID=3080561 RepID=UPI0029541DA8|nr:transporter substrate-binding domain-containing protein [Terasakiella sp. A23]MDV7338094.1 transporter substrate-binding domain-containing protein [Terasakiella sp. A23]